MFLLQTSEMQDCNQKGKNKVNELQRYIFI